MPDVKRPYARLMKMLETVSPEEQDRLASFALNEIRKALEEKRAAEATEDARWEELLDDPRLPDLLDRLSAPEQEDEAGFQSLQDFKKSFNETVQGRL